jgi:hypothetical protein
MLQTTLICGIGISAFTFSSFVPTANLALLMIALLATALLGDLVFLPALLVGPLGRPFEKRVPVPAAAPSRAAGSWSDRRRVRRWRRRGPAVGVASRAAVPAQQPELAQAGAACCGGTCQSLESEQRTTVNQ